MKINTKKGTYTIEAAIILPLVIVGVLTLAYVIYSVYVTEDIAYIASDEAKELSLKSYDIKTSIGFSGALEERIEEENSKAHRVKVSNMGYLYRKNGVSELISFDVKYSIDTNLPLNFITDSSNSDSYLFRAFTGKSSKWSPSSFDEMEGNSKEVWVFPDSGKKYHKESCTHVKSNFMRGILTKDLKRKYNECENCEVSNKDVGSLVFYFPNYGESYHTGNCKSVDKYTISIDENQAKQRGYTPCLKCGG